MRRTPARRSVRRARRPAGRALSAAALAAATLAAAPATATAQQPASQAMPDAFSIDTGEWRGGAYARPATLDFSHCGIARPYGETTLIFTRTPEHGLNIGLDGVAPPEAEGDRPAVALLTVDGATERALPAVPAGAEVTVLPVGEDADLVDRLRRGTTLTVRLDERELEYPLTGTFDALPLLADCVEAADTLSPDRVAALLDDAEADADADSDADADAETAVGQEPREGEAEAAEPQAAEPAADAEVAAAPVEDIDQETLTRLLAAAGFENIAFARSDELPDNALDLDYAWQLDGRIVGGLHQRPRGEENELDAFIQDYVQRVRTVCPGDTEADIGEVETFRDRFGLGRATVTCRAGETVAYIELFMALDDRHYSAFFHEATPAERAFAIEATESIGSVIREMAGL